MPRFISTETPKWTNVLANTPHDFYALPCFTALDASWTGGEATAYNDEGTDLLIPLVRHQSPDGTIEAVSPYGYPGLVTEASENDLYQALERFCSAGMEEGLVTSFIRLHPLLNSGVEEALCGIENCTVVEHGPTVWVSLEEEDEDWVNDLSKGLRRDLRVLNREGYKVEFDGSDAIEAFMVCYHASMERVDASDMYLFDRAYIERFLDCLGDAVSICVVRTSEGEPACAGLFTCVSGIAQYHLSGTHPDHFSLGPNKAMLTAARAWARDRGARAFHLGGGVGGRKDGLFNFKKRFGSRHTPFQSLRVIHDVERYDALHRDWLRRNKLASAPNPEYFPIYRQPL